MQRIAAIDWVVFSLYVCALGVASVHLYRTPIYAMDAVQYMGNALLMEDTDIVSVHRRVYAELNRWCRKGRVAGCWETSLPPREIRMIRAGNAPKVRSVTPSSCLCLRFALSTIRAFGY